MGEQLIFDSLQQTVEKSVDEGSPLPAAVSRHGLELNGVVGDGVAPLSQPQYLPTRIMSGRGPIEDSSCINLLEGLDTGEISTPSGSSPLLGFASQLGDDVRHPGCVCGKRTGLDAENELTLRQEAPALSRGSIIRLGRW